MKLQGFLIAMIMMIPQQNNDWLNREMYPFTDRYIDLEQGKMHYVDEGEGDILLFVHGTPTWSFLYRNYIQHFRSTYRCIAIDHIGFGLSDKPKDLIGIPENHSANLIEFIEKLDLRNITLVVHDFGGPIGLSTAIAMPERFNRIITFNTWLWETADDAGIKKIDRLVRGPLGKFLYLDLNFSPRVLLKQGFRDKRRLSKEIHRQYLCPFDKKRSRNSLWQLAKSLRGSSDWYGAQFAQIDSIRNKPWLILWGMHDSFITPEYLAKWQETVPGAEVYEFESGHFVQEESTSESIEAIASFLRKKVQ